VPPIDFCSCQETRARPRLHQTLPWVAMASHRMAGDVALARQHPPGLHSSGVAWARGPRQHPASASARRHGFTPTCSNPDTSCRSLVPAVFWKPRTACDGSDLGAGSAKSVPPVTKTVAFAVWENQLARLTAPKHGSPCRAASRRASRKNPTFDRTRGAFHLRDPIPLDPGRQPSRRRSSLCRSGQPDTFVTSDGRRP
jgi:hypothetical protein